MKNFQQGLWLGVTFLTGEESHSPEAAFHSGSCTSRPPKPRSGKGPFLGYFQVERRWLWSLPGKLNNALLPRVLVTFHAGRVWLCMSQCGDDVVSTGEELQGSASFWVVGRGREEGDSVLSHCSVTCQLLTAQVLRWRVGGLLSFQH